MRKLVIGTFVTLDGVMQAPGGPNEDRDGGFAHGGWSVNYWDEMMGGLIVAQMQRPDALLLGRRTYEIFAAHWPRVTDETDPVASKLNSMRKYVASRTLQRAEWHNTTVIPGDVSAYVADLKSQPGGEIQVAGSSGLIQTLLEHDLIDEFHLWVFPLVVGAGKRLFGSGTVPGGLELLDTAVSTTGVAIQRYARAGGITTGTFEVDQAGRADELWKAPEPPRDAGGAGRRD
jgi:dihydrofolate reductase